jgi:RNA polymerase sigma factor (sigma-70 family)
MSLLVGNRALLERFRLGERAALEEVYRHYAPQLALFLARGFTFHSQARELYFRGFKEPFDLDNAIQETFTRAFSHDARQSYDGLNPYKNYLFAIARNWVISELRRKDFVLAVDGREQELGGAETEGEREAIGLGEGSGSAESDFLARELGELYDHFLKELDDRDRVFFRARFEEQRGQVDAGQVAGLSHMQARTLEKKLRKRFLAFLKNRGYLEWYGNEAAGAAAVGVPSFIL